MLGNPDIAESKTKDFNEQYPHFAVTQSDTVKMDDGLAPTDEGAGQNSGDDLLAQLGIYRARMVRKELWAPAVLDFHRAWEGYKRDCNLVDFQDLIDRALEAHYPPFRAQICIADEAQDFTPVQLKLLRRWAKYLEWLLISGDDDQTLYSFTGATPEAFLNPPVSGEYKKILRQSYRVPTKVLHLANRIISKISVREPKEYKPRDHDGKIFTSNATWKKPDNIIPVIKGYVSEGKRVMVLATCSYMLGPLIAQLRDRGIPFSNIYKANRGDWNPIRKRQTGNAGAYGRLCAYMAPQGGEFRGVRLWTPQQLESWAEPLRVEGNFLRGAKKELREMCKTKDLAPEVILGVMLGALTEDAFDSAVSFDLEWFLSQITPAKQKAYDFPARVFKECGLDGPEMARMCTVGTVHSVKGAEADCSPYDEPVLTINRGYVPIGELDPERDTLVSFNSRHHKIHRGGPKRPNGYKFTKASRPYSGKLLTIETAASRTRVTPNHHLTVRWSEEALEKHIVYLMRRGNWWKIGVTKLKGYGTSSGISNRLNPEKADCAWALGFFDTRKEALYYEQLWGHTYRVPDLNFEAECRNENQLTSLDLHKIWDAIDSQSGALKLLEDRGMSPEWPLWQERVADKPMRRRQTGTRNRWLMRAANLVSGMMEIPTDPGKGLEPRWLPVAVSEEDFTGTVYSLDVEKWHHYVSGGAIVHNCVILFPDLSLRGAQHYAMRQGEQFEQILRQFYVGVTRTRDILVLCQGLSRGMFFDDYK